jgi:1A family penicillin-binding protein
MNQLPHSSNSHSASHHSAGQYPTSLHPASAAPGNRPPVRPARPVGSVPPPVNRPPVYGPGGAPPPTPPPSQPQQPATGGGVQALNGVLLGVLVFLIAVLLGLGLFLTSYVVVARALPPADQLAALTTHGQNTRIYARDGSLLQAPLAPDDPTAGLRRRVPLAEISPYLIDAVIATEDANFYKHRGVDPVALSRAIFRALQTQGPVIGTSTISQQLAKLVFLSPERTLTRKVKEAILAAEITRRSSKDEILEIYLNEIYYGNMAYGIEAAARLYFNKSARELTLAEAALLAGLPQAPAVYDPLQSPEAAKARQADVLRLMVEHGAISAEEAEAAWRQPLVYYGGGLESTRLDKAPHFVMTVRGEIERLYGPELLYRGGLQVYTSLDPRLQAEAEQQVRAGVAELQGRNVSNGALVAQDPRTGEILAMVGSADFNDVEISGQVNVATAPRQPGSTIKPFTYLATFERPTDWWTAATLIDDVRTEFDDGPGRPPYVPVNYDGRDHGRVSVRAALANSYNIPAVKALQHVGVAALLQTAERFGMATLTQAGHPPYGLALTLGGGEVTLLELTNAYGALANGGIFTPPTPILCVLDADGVVLERVDVPGLPEACRTAPLATRAIQRAPVQNRITTPEHSYILTDILKDNEARTPAFGADSWLQIGRPAAVKTGTTNDVRDIWTIGYTPELVTGVWVGNADGAPMDRNLSGIAGAGPIWNRFMRAALANVAPQDFARPAGITSVEICTLTGGRADSSCPADRRRMELFAADQLPLGAETIQPGNVEVALSWPLDGQTAAGVIPIRGSASIPNFDHYLVEYGESFEPGAWGVVAGPVAQPVLNGELAQWNVGALANDGPHMVRVVAVDQQGARVESPAVRVVVLRDATATPSPTETATPTETPLALPSPSPTATETPLALPSPSPTATATPTPAAPLPAAILAEIVAPLDGDVLAGQVSILGTAAGASFASYGLEVLLGDVWTPLTPDAPLVFTPTAGVLGLWDTTTLPNGAYILRMIVNGVGGELAVDTVSVVIAN